jgi:membrane-associated phospholipid phosphatase
MSNNDVTLNENDATPATQTRSLTQPFHLQVARYVSTILSPFAVSLPLIFLIALYHAPMRGQALFYACVTLFFLSIGPLLYIIVGVRLGKFTDIDVSVRSQRTWPFVFGLASGLVGLLILTLTRGSRNLETLLLITLLSGIILMVITLWWKISLHASSIAGAATILTAFYGSVMLPAFLLVIAVSWSRVVLRRHTVSQVTAGAILSIVLTVLILTIRNR